MKKLRQGHKWQFGVFAMVAVASLLFVPPASASVIGTLDVANCANGAVNVTLTTIDWILPVDAGNGCVQNNTGIFYGPTASKPLPSGLGLILDLPGGPANFMVFTNGTDIVSFDLGGLGPGVANTVCTVSPCSVTSTSPFILMANATGTSVTLTAFGLARDNLSAALPNDIWSGAFTTQVAGQTPAQIQATILGGGTIHSTWSGEFIVSIPEPVSMSLIGGGLMALAWLRRRRVQA